MSRAVLRFVVHRIRRHPESEAVAAARCLHGACAWEAAPSLSVGDVDDQCMAHTGLNAQHTTFARTFSDVALVERVEGAA